LDIDSVLIGSKAEWVVFDKFIHAGWQQRLQTATAIKPEWVIVSTWLHHIFCHHSNT
jgi:hypothetical protein